MRKITFLFLMITSLGYVHGATGWFDDYITIKKDGTSTTYYIGSSGTGTALNSVDFGTISTELIITAVDMKYWSDTQDRTGGSFYYKILASDNSTQIVAPVDTSWNQTAIGGNDYRGTLSGLSISLLSGLEPNKTYKLHVWAKSTGGNQGDSWLSNSGSNYVATFTTPSTFNYRSKSTGDWGSVSSWETSLDGINNWSDASSVPTSSTASSINIRNGHTITVNGNTIVSSININTGAVLTVASSIELQTNGAITNSGTFNVNGTLQINAGGSVNTNSPSYGTSSTLVYNTGGTYGRFLEFNNPANVTIANSTTLNYPNGNNSYNSTLSGNLQIDNGSALYMDYGTGSQTGKITVNGNVILNGNLSLGDGLGGDLYVAGNLNIGASSVFVDHGRAIFLNGITEQTITLGKDLTIAYLIIEPGSKVTLANGNTLTATNFTLNSNSSLGTATFKNNGNLATTNVWVNQYLAQNGSRQWWYLASPLSGATSDVIRPAESGHLIGDYSEVTTSYSAPFAAGSGTSLTAGKGYVVKFENTNARTITFTGGGLNNGDIAPIVTRTGTSAAKRGFNLVGNPYPSYIDWDAIHAESTNMRDAIWFRTMDGVMKFHTYSDGEGVPSLDANNQPLTITGKIAPMQAFWVKVDADPVFPATVSNGTLTFKNTHRSHKAETGYNPLKVKAADNRQRLRLTISNGSVQDETLLVSKSYASNGLDSYDIEKMSASSTDVPEIYSLVKNEELVINSMNELSAGTVVGLGIRPGQAGNFTLKVSQFENITNDVYLVDHTTNTETELTADTEYFFTSDATSTNERFSVEFRAPGITTAVTESNAANTFVFVNEAGQIGVQSAAGKNARISVYNTAGQQLASQLATGSVTFIQQSFSSGVYLVKVNNLLQKVVIN